MPPTGDRTHPPGVCRTGGGGRSPRRGPSLVCSPITSELLLCSQRGFFATAVPQTQSSVRGFRCVFSAGCNYGTRRPSCLGRERRLRTGVLPTRAGASPGFSRRPSAVGWQPLECLRSSVYGTEGPSGSVPFPSFGADGETASSEQSIVVMSSGFQTWRGTRALW